MAMSSIPEEIQTDIFLRLPFKSILSCRHVCKVWRELLYSHNLIKTHLILANPKLLLKACTYENPKVLFRSIDYGSISSALFRSRRKVTCGGDVPMDYVYRDMRCDSINMLGSCNGLVCMSLNSYQDICIWNPSTGEYRKTPLPSSNFFAGASYCNLGHVFYYDCIGDDYKLVRIGEREKSGDYQVDVYVLGSELWEKFESVNHYIFPVDMANSVSFIDGALHWISVNNIMGVISKVIVSFDVGSKRFVDFFFPGEVEQLISNTGLVHDSVGVLDDRLSLGIYHKNMYLIDIWLMQEYGVRQSWTKRFSCSTSNNPLYRGWKLLWSFANGELLIDTRLGKLVCDPKNDTSRVFKVQGMGGFEMRWSIPLNCVESLVSPNSIGY